MCEKIGVMVDRRSGDDQGKREDGLLGKMRKAGEDDDKSSTYQQRLSYEK